MSYINNINDHLEYICNKLFYEKNEFVIDFSKIKFKDVDAYIAWLLNDNEYCCAIQNTKKIRFVKVCGFKHSTEQISIIKYYEYLNNKDSSAIIYFSGYVPPGFLKPFNNLTIGPRYKYFKPDIIRSGVNYIECKPVVNYHKEFHNLYIGNTLRNKNALLTLIILFIRLKLYKESMYGICVIRKESENTIYYILLRFISSILLKFKDVKFHFIHENIKNNEVQSLISKSKNLWILYFKEGFPRVIEESIQLKCNPIVWKLLRFGSYYFDKYYSRYTIIQMVCKKLAQQDLSYTFHGRRQDDEIIAKDFHSAYIKFLDQYYPRLLGALLTHRINKNK